MAFGFQGQRARNVLFPKSPYDIGMEGQRDEGQVVRPAVTNPSEDAMDAADDPMNYLKEYKRIYDTPGPATTAYKEHLKTIPNIADYKPGVGTRIASGLAGISAGFRDAGKGIEVAQNLNQSKYRQALGEYGMKEKNLATSAKIEDQETENKIKFLKDAETSGTNYRKYLRDTAKDTADQTFKNRQQDNLERHYREQEKSWFQPKGSDYKYLPQADGSYIKENSVTGTRTTVPGNSVEAARMKDQQKRTNIAGMAADTARIMGFGRIAADNRRDMIAERNLKLKETRPGKTPRPQDREYAQTMVADEMARETRWNKYLGEPQGTYKTRKPISEQEAKGDPGYKNFMAEYNKRIEKMLGQPYRGDDNSDEEDDSEFEEIGR